MLWHAHGKHTLAYYLLTALTMALRGLRYALACLCAFLFCSPLFLSSSLPLFNLPSASQFPFAFIVLILVLILVDAFRFFISLFLFQHNGFISFLPFFFHHFHFVVVSFDTSLGGSWFRARLHYIGLISQQFHSNTCLSFVSFSFAHSVVVLSVEYISISTGKSFEKCFLVGFLHSCTVVCLKIELSHVKRVKFSSFLRKKKTKQRKREKKHKRNVFTIRRLAFEPPLIPFPLFSSIVCITICLFCFRHFCCCFLFAHLFGWKHAHESRQPYTPLYVFFSNKTSVKVNDVWGRISNKGKSYARQV